MIPIRGRLRIELRVRICARSKGSIDILVDANLIACRETDIGLAANWDWTSLADGLMTVRRAVNIVASLRVGCEKQRREGGDG